MGAYRVDLLIDDPDPVFEWIDAAVRGKVVGKVAYQTALGWHMKVVFKLLEDAEAFHRHWRPNEAGYVPPWGAVNRTASQTGPAAFRTPPPRSR